MDRLNLSSDDARTRIKNFINERVRALQTSCSLGNVRAGIVTVLTVADEAQVELDGVVLPRTLSIPAQNRVLTSKTLDSFRVLDPSGSTRGVPSQYAIALRAVDNTVVELLPVPDAEYGIKVDGILSGVELVDDSDIPAFPEDFHDTIIFGVCADENTHWDKLDRFTYYENKFKERRAEARFFISRQIYLHRVQNGMSFDFSSASWWWLYGAPVITP
jgi:hypothetical protein